MTQTAFGIVFTRLGHARSEAGFWATPAAQVRSTQDPAIPVDQEHDHRTIGEVVALVRDSDSLWCIAHLRDDIEPIVRVRVGAETRAVPQPLHWSAERIGGGDYGFLLRSVTITSTPARICPGPPLRLLPGDLNFRREPPRSWELSPSERELLRRACESHRGRRHGDPLVIQDVGRESALDRLNALPAQERAAATMQLLDADRWGAAPGPIRHTSPYRGAVVNVR